MFSRTSRYRKVPDVVTVDLHGRTLASKEMRPLPNVSGIFRHTVAEVDRLDHLAYKYYRQPRRWWRIIDANPEFPSPQALLGKEPLVTVRFTHDAGNEPVWADILRPLRQLIGVSEVQVVEQWQLVAQLETVNGQQVEVQVDQFERAIVVTYNEMNISVGELTAVIEAAGFSVGQPEPIGRIGKPIVIPPDTPG